MSERDARRAAGGCARGRRDVRGLVRAGRRRWTTARVAGVGGKPPFSFPVSSPGFGSCILKYSLLKRDKPTAKDPRATGGEGGSERGSLGAGSGGFGCGAVVVVGM